MPTRTTLYLRPPVAVGLCLLPLVAVLVGCGKKTADTAAAGRTEAASGAKAPVDAVPPEIREQYKNAPQ